MSTISRREILSRFSLGAGALVMSPMLRALELQASGSASLPKRFVFVIEGNGFIPGNGIPGGVNRANGGVTDVSLKQLKLPYALEPLAPFQDKLTIVQKLSGVMCGGGHSNNFGALGAYSGKSGVAGETIDGALAKALPGVFPHVGLGIGNRRANGVIYNISAQGKGQPIPTQCNPQQAYNSLFASVANGSGKQVFDARTHLLDFMKDDIKRVEARVAGPEKQKLESYLSAFETLRNRQSRLGQIESTLRKSAPAVSDKYNSALETDRLDAHFDLAAAALITGLTNVVTISSGAGDDFFDMSFPGLGITIDKHSLGHGKPYEGKNAGEVMATIHRFHMEQIARLTKKLQETPEGNGTMMDNTLIVYTSDAAESHHARCFEWPFVLVGNLGGKIKAGKYIEYPAYGKSGHHTIANLYCTLLHAAGAPRDRFGWLDGNLKEADQKGPLKELLA